MVQDLINKLIVVASIMISITVLYFIVSPYQNCLRSYDDKYVDNYGRSSMYGGGNITKQQYCVRVTQW